MFPCQPCAQGAARQRGARACGRGLRLPARRSSPFFLADPRKGGRLGGGTAKGGIPSLVRAEDWPLSRLGAPAERRRDGDTSAGRRARRGEPQWGFRAVSRGERGPQSRPGSDAPGGALAPEGVSRPQIEQFGNGRAERRRAGRPGQSCGGRLSRPRPRPSRACPRRGWQRRGESPLRGSVLSPSAPSLGPGVPRAPIRGLPFGRGRRRTGSPIALSVIPRKKAPPRLPATNPVAPSPLRASGQPGPDRFLGSSATPYKVLNF